MRRSAGRAVVASVGASFAYVVLLHSRQRLRREHQETNLPLAVAPGVDDALYAVADREPVPVEEEAPTDAVGRHSFIVRQVTADRHAEVVDVVLEMGSAAGESHLSAVAQVARLVQCRVVDVGTAASDGLDDRRVRGLEDLVQVLAGCTGLPGRQARGVGAALCGRTRRLLAGRAGRRRAGGRRGAGRRRGAVARPGGGGAASGEEQRANCSESEDSLGDTHVASFREL